ncbi:hypothetical protein [Brevundimonas vesicularis]|jgi:hypothetical protein|uniref:hypothetical protein n=1 Tax=Brevundimonas vesicularis TaxID=41276 RepID=UPI00384CCE7F
MGRFLDKLSRDDPAYELSASDDGYTLISRAGHEDEFNELARDLIDNAGSEFVVLPSSDGQVGYERVFIIPI